MTRDEVLRATASFTVPAALVIGGSLATLAVASGRAYQPEASQPHPTPTVTVTQVLAPLPSAEPSVGASRTLVPAVDAPNGGVTGRPVVAEQAPARRPQSPVPGGDSPIPSPTSGTGSKSCTGTVTAVHEPLGVLPGCAITIGGRR